MKKFITFLAILGFCIGTSFAQEGKSAPAKTTQAKKPESKDVKTEKTEKAGEHLKKDGTPDKRYKENKEAKPAAGPTKKDGTPDKRYKSNKDAAKPTKPAPKK
jgi:hypothetical protein